MSPSQIKDKFKIQFCTFQVYVWNLTFLCYNKSRAKLFIIGAIILVNPCTVCKKRNSHTVLHVQSTFQRWTRYHWLFSTSTSQLQNMNDWNQGTFTALLRRFATSLISVISRLWPAGEKGQFCIQRWKVPRNHILKCVERRKQICCLVVLLLQYFRHLIKD